MRIGQQYNASATGGNSWQEFFATAGKMLFVGFRYEITA